MRTLAKIMIMVLAVLSVTSAVLGVFVLRRDRIAQDRAHLPGRVRRGAGAVLRVRRLGLDRLHRDVARAALVAVRPGTGSGPSPRPDRLCRPRQVVRRRAAGPPQGTGPATPAGTAARVATTRRRAGARLRPASGLAPAPAAAGLAPTPRTTAGLASATSAERDRPAPPRRAPPPPRRRRRRPAQRHPTEYSARHIAPGPRSHRVVARTPARTHWSRDSRLRRPPRCATAEEIIGRREHPDFNPERLKRPQSVLIGCIMAWIGCARLAFGAYRLDAGRLELVGHQPGRVAGRHRRGGPGRRTSSAAWSAFWAAAAPHLERCLPSRVASGPPPRLVVLAGIRRPRGTRRPAHGVAAVVRHRGVLERRRRRRWSDFANPRRTGTAPCGEWKAINAGA